MLGRTKIRKPAGQDASDFEQSIAQELFNLEVILQRRATFTRCVITKCPPLFYISNLTKHITLQVTSDMKADLKDLFISAAKELEIDGGRKAIVMFVPYRQLKDYHKIQQRLVRELEKKFSGKHVIIIGQRTILPKVNPNIIIYPRRSYPLILCNTDCFIQMHSILF